ncbi:glycosyltransferase family 1 protein [Algoriphagus lutimaris]|uniref:glycosyltransferase n=1 Tax=Algoriphagus lutimaris TaxID=613197 RepID=UPI00196B12C7|nr:glycosyltransferase [Algoriphagus lutimaris]MBN3518983.1 glycosyltransferase family 1 protein [Algoriphagus lutimaris]
MKILLVSMGTRGDIEPFLAQAEFLKNAGHEITCQFPEQFRKMTEALGYSFLGFDKGFLEMLESQSGKAVMGGGSSFKQLKGYLNLIMNSLKIQKLIIQQQKEALEEINPDKVLFHAKALYHYLGAMANPRKFMLLSPIPCLIHQVKEFPHIGLAKWKPFSEKWNLKSYRFVNGVRHRVMKRLLKPYYGDFPKIEINSNTLNQFESNQLRTLYTISPSLFPFPDYWPKTAKITGYFFRNQIKTYQINPGLNQWIEKNPKAVLLTFGSMTNPNPKKYSELLINLLIKHRIPTIVNLSWGGLEKINIDSDLIFYVNQIPYDWVLPKMYGMIHHGGSGTTHHAAINGCVQLIIPHIVDQYFCNRVILKRGLGPQGPSIHNITSYNFEKALLEFWNQKEFKTQANAVANRMISEALIEKNIKEITQE